MLDTLSSLELQRDLGKLSAGILGKSQLLLGGLQLQARSKRHELIHKLHDCKRKEGTRPVHIAPFNADATAIWGGERC
eukprot:1153467-Pelagomonas_calceolata.AAC.5